MSGTALHSVHLPQTYDSSFKLWPPCVNKEVQYFGAIGSSSKLEKLQQKCRIRKAVGGKGGHCTLLKVIALPKMGPLQS